MEADCSVYNIRRTILRRTISILGVHAEQTGGLRVGGAAVDFQLVVFTVAPCGHIAVIRGMCGIVVAEMVLCILSDDMM